MIQKQTVYLPVSDFHSSERAICTIGIPDLYGDRVIEKEGYFFTKEQLNEYTSNIIKQTLETAAERSYVEYIDLKTNETFDYTDVITDDGVGANVCKQSITNTFEEVYQKLKV